MLSSKIVGPNSAIGGKKVLIRRALSTIAESAQIPTFIRSGRSEGATLIQFYLSGLNIFLKLFIFLHPVVESKAFWLLFNIG